MATDFDERSRCKPGAVPIEVLAGGKPTTPVILALDLGQRTGWAVRNRDGAIASGVHEFRPGRFEGGGMIWLRFRAWLQEIDETAGGVGVVVFEEVRQASRHQRGTCVRRLPRASHRLGRGEPHPVPGRAGRHDQAAHRRQGQRRQAGGDRRCPQARLRAGRRQRGRRAGAAATGRSRMGSESSDERRHAAAARRRRDRAPRAHLRAAQSFRADRRALVAGARHRGHARRRWRCA